MFSALKLLKSTNKVHCVPPPQETFRFAEKNVWELRGWLQFLSIMPNKTVRDCINTLYCIDQLS